MKCKEYCQRCYQTEDPKSNMKGCYHGYMFFHPNIFHDLNFYCFILSFQLKDFGLTKLLHQCT